MQNKKAIILIYGSPGSGKSTFSKYLLKISPTPLLLIHADQIQSYFSQRGDIIIPKKQINESCSFISLVTSEPITPVHQRQDFSPSIWKKSRKYIKDNISVFLSLSDVVIIQDDMLLKSIRKFYKQYAAKQNIMFLEIMMNTSLQQCQQWNRMRGQKIASQVLQNKFNKIQISGVMLQPKQRNVSWQFIVKHLQVPLLAIEQTPEVQNHIKSFVEETEIKIRRYISRVLKNQQTDEIFKNKNRVEVAKMLSLLKKQFDAKRGFQEFKDKVNKLFQQMK